MSSEPSDFHPDLTWERLKLMASILIRAWRTTMEDTCIERGDDTWVQGCMAYGRAKNLIIEAAPQHEWLTILDPTLKFRFLIGQVPIRFWHGDLDRPKPSLLLTDRAEVEAQQLAFPFGEHI